CSVVFALARQLALSSWHLALKDRALAKCQVLIAKCCFLDVLRAFTERLQNHTPNEGGIVDQVAHEESPRLGAHAEKPFHADALHPARRHRLVAAQEVEGGADARHHAAAHATDVLGHESFHGAGTHSHPEDVSAGGVHAFDNLGVFFGGERTERRAVSSGHLQSREAFTQVLSEAISDAGHGAVEVMLPAARKAVLTRRQHQVGAAYALHVLESLQ